MSDDFPPEPDDQEPDDHGPDAPESDEPAAPETFHLGALAPGLYITATPIGNAKDISVRALHAIENADVVLCEDTRVTSKLLAIYNLKAKLRPYHDHNAEYMRPRILAGIESGQAIVLVSDAGTPLISDPGYKLVRDVRAADLMVTTLPGASSVLAALCIAGLPTDRFFFQGFLPSKSTARCRVLEELKPVPATLVILESAKRLARSLKDMDDVLGPRDAAVTRELTKRFEEVRTGTLAELTAHYEEAGSPKGEVVLIIGPPNKAAESAAYDINAALQASLKTMTLKDAVKHVATQSGRPRKEVYTLALELSQNLDQD